MTDMGYSLEVIFFTAATTGLLSARNELALSALRRELISGCVARASSSA
jgi:hypothetical protein